VFFLTPQCAVGKEAVAAMAAAAVVLELTLGAPADLTRDCFQAKEVVCVVIDEAHRALGDHAYCKLIEVSFNKCFLPLCLADY